MPLVQKRCNGSGHAMKANVSNQLMATANFPLGHFREPRVIELGQRSHEAIRRQLQQVLKSINGGVLTEDGRCL